MTPEEILILTRLIGAREFVAGAQAESAALGELGAASTLTGKAFEHTTRRSWLMNQALFTLRRVTYGATLALLGISAVAIKMGWTFDQQMQTARVAMTGFLGGVTQANKELTYLYNLAAYTPLRFQDITNAARLLMGFGFTVNQTNRTLTDVIDMLTAMGRDSPASINRVAIALGHMKNIGYVTGQILMQLARDNIPVYEMLQKQLHLTANQLHNIGKQKIPADVVMEAIQRGIEQDPRYHGAARRLALTTFHGLFTTMQDFAAQFFGNIEKPLFQGAQNQLRGLVGWFQVLGTVAQQTHGNLTAIVKVFDQRWTPGSHGVMLFWTMFRGAVHDAWIIFKTFISSMTHSTVVWGTVIAALAVLRGALWQAKQTMGLWIPVIKILIPLFIAWVTYQKAMAFWTGINKIATAALTKETKALSFAEFAAALAMGRFEVVSKATAAATWLMVQAQTALWAISLRLRVALATLTAVAATNPVLLIITAVALLTTGLVILYFKWKAFHDLVNATASFIVRNWRYVLIALWPVLGPLALMVGAVATLVKQFRDLTDWARRAAHEIRKAFGWAGNVVGAVGGGATKALSWAMHPHFASGGVMQQPGFAWVGERGPELLALPGGSRIYNQEQSAPFRLSDRFNINIKVMPQPIYLDKRQITEVVADVIADVGARA